MQVGRTGLQGEGSGRKRMAPLEWRKLMFRMVAAVRGAEEEKGTRGGEADVSRREGRPT